MGAFDHISAAKPETNAFSHIPTAAENPSKGGAPTVGDTALEHFGNSLALGHLPQLQAVAEPITDKIGDFFTGGRVAQAAKEFPDQDSYVKRRDENIARLKAESEANPWTAGGASVVGAIPPILATGGGAGVVRGAAQGAALGAAYNPGDTAGVVEPGQFMERGAQGLTGAAVGGAVGAAGKLPGYFKDRAKVKPILDSLKEPAAFQKMSADEFQGALKSMDESYIAPRMEKLKEVISGKTVKVDANALEAAGFPEKAAEIRKIAAEQTGPLSETFGAALPKGAQPSIAEVPAERGLEIRRLLDKNTKFATPKSGADVEAAARQSDAITKAANDLRSQINDIPGARLLNEETHEAITLRDLVEDRARTPVTAASPPKLSDKMADLQNFDKTAGTDLSGFAKRTAIAKSLRLNPKDLVNLMKAPGEVGTLADRLGTEVSPYVNKYLLRGGK